MLVYNFKNEGVDSPSSSVTNKTSRGSVLLNKRKIHCIKLYTMSQNSVKKPAN